MSGDSPHKDLRQPVNQTIECTRCKKQAAPPESVPFPGKLAEEIRSKTCAACWAEWEQAEVMVINEFRLDFMNPESQDVLIRHMREFLCLDGPPSE